MPVSLDELPFDVWFYISASLDLDDTVHLGYTCRQLQSILSESTLCRRTVEVCVEQRRRSKFRRKTDLRRDTLITVLRRH